MPQTISVQPSLDGDFFFGERHGNTGAWTEITVKGKRCLVINPNQREVGVKVHWLPPKVPDELIVRQLERFGKVQHVVRDSWRKPRLSHMTGTSSVYHVIPKSLTALKGVPHQAIVQGTVPAGTTAGATE